MSGCPACAVNMRHRTDLPDLIRCIKCHEVKSADHNHVMCRDCERGR